MSALQGVAVAAYGADEFPAFFTRHSGCRAPMRVDTPEDAAAMIRAGLQLNLNSGIVIGVHSPSPTLMQNAGLFNFALGIRCNDLTGL